MFCFGVMDVSIYDGTAHASIYDDRAHAQDGRHVQDGEEDSCEIAGHTWWMEGGQRTAGTAPARPKHARLDRWLSNEVLFVPLLLPCHPLVTASLSLSVSFCLRVSLLAPRQFLSLSLSVSVCLCLSVCLSLSLSLSLCLSPPPTLPVQQFKCPDQGLGRQFELCTFLCFAAVISAVSRSVSLCLCLSVYLSVCLSVCLSLCLYVCLSVCLPRLYPSLCTNSTVRTRYWDRELICASSCSWLK